MKARSVPSCFGVGPAGVGVSARGSASAMRASRSASRAARSVVGEVELFEHLVDAVSHGQELSAGGLLGDVERAACAGQPVGALGEEVVAAVSLAQVVLLPGLFSAGGGAGEDGLAVDEDLDGADVAGEAVGLLVGRGEGCAAGSRRSSGVLAGCLCPSHCCRSLSGIGPAAAEIIIAETGGDMVQFATAGHLASWIGVCPVLNESAGVTKSARTCNSNSNGNLKRLLSTAAVSVTRKKDCYPSADYRRIAARRGRPRALVAVMHKLAVAIWHILRHKTRYQDLGADSFTRRDPEHAMRPMTKEANRLGLTVRFEPIAATA